MDEDELRAAVEIFSGARTSKALEKIRKPALLILASTIGQHVPALTRDQTLLTLNKKPLTEKLFEAVSIYSFLYPLIKSDVCL